MGDPVPVSFGKGSNKARFGQLGQASFLNARVEEIGEAGKHPFSAVAVPGSLLFSQLDGIPANAGVEAMLVMETQLMVLAGRLLFAVDENGSETIVGGVISDGFATMARNRRTPSAQIVIVRDGLWYVVDGGTITPGSDADLPPPVCVFEVAGYFVFPIADGRVFYAGPNDVTVDPLDFLEAEANADRNVMGIARGRTAIVFGERSTEFLDLSSDPDAVFVPTTAINFGCWAAGSVARVAMQRGDAVIDAIVLAATDGEGEYVGVCALEGYNLTRISTPEVDRAIRDEPDRSSIRAFGWTEADGRSFYAITGSSFSYEYNCRIGEWGQRKSHGLSRWSASCAATFAGKTLFGDYRKPVIYSQRHDVLDEAGDPIVWQITLPPIHMWPRSFQVSVLHVDMVTGVGATPESDGEPELIIDYSRDGGHNFTAATRHPLGTAGNRDVRIKRRGLGRFTHNGMTLRLTSSARTARVLAQVAIDAQPLMD